MKKIYIAGMALITAVSCIYGCSASPKESSSAEKQPENSPAPEQPEISPVPEEPSPEERAEAYMQRMSDREKIEQMLMPAVRVWDEKPFTVMNDTVSGYFSEHHFGGFIVFLDNCTGTDQTVDLIMDLQEAAVSSGGAPMFISVDQEGGSVSRLSNGITGIGNMALCATGSTNKTREMASLMAEELQAAGFNVDFAPVMDVNCNPSNPIIGIRSFSDDPSLCAEYGTAFIEGLHAQNIAASLKHFPGHGDTDTDSHTGLPRVDRSLEELRQRELIPFAAGIRAGADMIMTAHIQYPQIEPETCVSVQDGNRIYLPATCSKRILTDLLREEMGFEGVICTDSLQMDAVRLHFEPTDLAKRAINAGADILLMPVTIENEEGLTAMTAYIDGIEAMVRDGSISRETIDAAVRRILTLKYKNGLMDQTFNEQTRQAYHDSSAVIGSEEHHAKEREIGGSAVTLLLNKGILPVQKGTVHNVLAVGMRSDHAPLLSYAFHVLQDEGAVARDTSFTGMSLSYGDNTQACINALDGKDLLILTTNMYSTSQLDITQSESMAGTYECMQAAHAKGIPVIVISSGQPYDVILFQEADAILCTYCPVGMTQENGKTIRYGVMLQCAEDVIFGKTGARGTLPLELPDVQNGAFAQTVRYSRRSGLRTQETE